MMMMMINKMVIVVSKAGRSGSMNCIVKDGQAQFLFKIHLVRPPSQHTAVGNNKINHKTI
jgi:hypothetical protein